MLAGIRHWQASRAFKAIPRDQRRIVFNAESGQEWHHFHPVVEYLTELPGESIIDITSTQQNIVEIRRDWVFNYGTSAVSAAMAIQEMLARGQARCSPTGDQT